jgi:outer membrane protein assembly factor BamB
MSIPYDDQPAAISSEPHQHPTPDTDNPTPNAVRKPLRVWPGVIAAVVLVLAWFVIPVLIPPAAGYGLLGGAVSVLVILLWWLIFSRARWYERIGVVALMVVALMVTKRLVHPSIAGGGMGGLLYVVAVPWLALALVAWAVATRRLSDGLRRAALLAAIVVVCVGFMLIRTGGLTATLDNDFHWRWSQTPEERLLAQAADEQAELAAARAATSSSLSTLSTSPGAKTSAEWPGFRGANRDGIVHGVRIATDWSASPPAEMWRRPIGPGWSSFAVSGDLLYTQEQRGADEVVACYNVITGKPVWKHSDKARFWESNGGSGPRGTPTLSNGRVYTLGATGILNVLKADDGSVVWSRNAVDDTKSKLPMWGFSGSPLVVGDLVIVATAGRMAAYELAGGQPRWVGPDGGNGYSSPQLFTIHGVPQILLLDGKGATSVAAADGKVLWQFPLTPGARIVQPALTAEGDVLVHEGESNEMRSLAVANESGGWTATERWNSFGVNPYFNDFVVHKGYVFGFNGSSIACMDLKDGQSKWKGGYYGHGQLVLLSDQDLLLVLSESGEVALVSATTDQFKELARIPAIKGKTWNHPVVVGDVLLVRNDQEMAAFKLAPAKS